MRYRFYRVHKYVCFELAEFDRAAAKTDFINLAACQALKEKLDALTALLKHHGEYEDAHIHELLRKKNSDLQLSIESEHQDHEQALLELMNQLQHIMKVEAHSEKIFMGNEFYLSYRLFYSEMLKHLYDEEKILLPRLQALYSDDELAKPQAQTYQKMTSEQMLGMLNLLFLHANPEDICFFANEMKAAQPEKFKMVWEGLADHYKQLISGNSCEALV